MIYFDNSATTLKKPQEVSEAVKYAVDNFGNSGRSFNESAMLAAREIYNTRVELAKLVKLDDPLKVAFTSSATESLNMIINGLINENDHVITTVYDHNSILRPLYNTGCELSIVELNETGQLDYEMMQQMIKSKTKAIVCTHASNVTGAIVDIKLVKQICKKNNVLFILDVSQSLGSIEVNANMADILCFTGHKSLFGPQGTGGIIAKDDIELKRIIKTGGAGSNSFAKMHSLMMPDAFEVGTLNAHSIYGLQQGVKFINSEGLEKIVKHKENLIEYFINELKKITGIKVYSETTNNCGVVAMNYKDVYSYDFAEKLYDEYQIATRAQSHCAPLLHEFYQTKEQGMVRFSFSYFNTIAEIEKCLEGIKIIIEKKEKEN